MPEEIGAQAVSVAVRMASCRDGAEALAHRLRPLYVMQTSQLT